MSRKKGRQHHPPPIVNSVSLRCPKKERQDKPIVVLAQIRFTGTELAQIFKSPDPLTWLQDTDDLRSHVRMYLDVAAEQRASLLVFPEASIPFSLLDELRAWTVKHPQCVVVAGSHWSQWERSVVSRTPVFFRGECFDSYKQVPAPDEQERGEEDLRVKPGPHLIYLRDTPCGNIGILVCSDYMTTSNREPYLSQTTDMDILCVPSCDRSPKEHFHKLISSAYERGSFNAYVLYCGLMDPNHGKGCSAVFGRTTPGLQQNLVETRRASYTLPYLLADIPDVGTYLALELDISQKVPDRPRQPTTAPNIAIRAYDWEWSNAEHRHVAVVRDRKSHYRLVCFDLDGTLLRGATFSWRAVWDSLGLQRKMHADLMQRYRTSITQETNRERRIQKYQDWCDAVTIRFREQKLSKQVLRDIAKPFTMPRNVLKALTELRSNGIKLALISGGIDVIMHAVVPPDVLQLFEDEIHINRFEFDDADLVTGVRATEFDFQGKAELLEALARKLRIDLSQTVFVGDSSVNDEYAFKRAGLAIGFGADASKTDGSTRIHVTRSDMMEVANIILGRGPGHAAVQLHDEILFSDDLQGTLYTHAINVIREWGRCIEEAPWRTDISWLDHGLRHRARMLGSVARLINEKNFSRAILGKASLLACAAVAVHDLGYFVNPDALFPDIASRSDLGQLPAEDHEILHEHQHRLASHTLRFTAAGKGPYQGILNEIINATLSTSSHIDRVEFESLINVVLEIVSEIVACHDLTYDEIINRCLRIRSQCDTLSFPIELIPLMVAIIRIADVIDRVRDRIKSESNARHLLRSPKPFRRYQFWQLLHCSLVESSRLEVNEADNSLTPIIELTSPYSRDDNSKQALQIVRAEFDEMLWQDGHGAISILEARTGFKVRKATTGKSRSGTTASQSLSANSEILTRCETIPKKPDRSEMDCLSRILRACPRPDTWIKLYHPMGFLFGGTTSDHECKRQFIQDICFRPEDWLPPNDQSVGQSVTNPLQLWENFHHRRPDLSTRFNLLRHEANQKSPAQWEFFAPILDELDRTFAVVNVHLAETVLSGDQPRRNEFADRLRQDIRTMGQEVKQAMLRQIQAARMAFSSDIVQHPIEEFRAALDSRTASHHRASSKECLLGTIFAHLEEELGSLGLPKVEFRKDPHRLFELKDNNARVFLWSEPWLRSWITRAIARLTERAGNSRDVSIGCVDSTKRPYVKIQIMGKWDDKEKAALGRDGYFGHFHETDLFMREGSFLAALSGGRLRLMDRGFPNQIATGTSGVEFTLPLFIAITGREHLSE